METFEEKIVYGIGCALIGIGAICLLPFTRRRLAGVAKPLLNRVGRAGTSEVVLGV
jgi:hypothetical protein